MDYKKTYCHGKPICCRQVGQSSASTKISSSVTSN